MNTELPVAGSASAELVQMAHDIFVEAAVKSGIDLSGFDSAASLQDRVAWAQAHDFGIGTILDRYSQKLQLSTTVQVKECLQFAMAQKIYVPPEFICIDEHKSSRNGLDRVKQILARRLAGILLVFNVSRHFRVARLGFRFFDEEVIKAGLRGISVGQKIDTDKKAAWKLLCYMHEFML